MGNWTRQERQNANEELCEKFNFSNEQLKKTIHSLRTSMLRELKRSQEQESYESSWKFYNHMIFMKEEILKSLQNFQEPEWGDEETSAIIEFYRENPVLWNHHLPEYRDRNLKKIALDRLRDELQNRSEEQIKRHWHALKTVFDREQKRTIGSKKSGASIDEVYNSSWKHFRQLEFLTSCTQVDPSLSTMSLTANYNENKDDSESAFEPPSKMKKGRSSCKRELDSIRMELYSNAIEALKSSSNSACNEHLTEEQSFGKMVGDHLTRFNARQRAIARKRISNVLFEVEMGLENIQPNAMFPNLFSQHSVNFSPTCNFPPNTTINQQEQSPISGHYTLL